MGQVQRLTRGQAKPYASIPRIDWAHPLAQKLAIYCYDIGGNYVDLVNGGQSKLTSTSGRASSKVGLGVSFPSAISFGSMPQNANATAAGQTAPFSAAIATFYPGALGALDGTLVCTGEVANTANTAIAFTTNNPDSNMGAIYNNGTTNVHYNKAISVGAFQSWGYTAKSSSAGDLYADGTLDQSISGITTTFTAGASQVIFNSAQANTQAFGGGLNGFLPYFAIWNNRALTAADYRQLHDDPYCFLIYPEDEMLAALVGTTAGGNIFNVSATEAATASETDSAVAVFAASDSETGIAVDSPSAQAVFVVSDTEAGTATDTPTAGTTTPAAITEAATATETEAVTAVFAASQTEAGTAADTDVSTATFAASATEAGSATDSDSASAVFAASDTEAATASDSETTSIDGSVSEAGTATETESATVVFQAAITETGTATDATTVTAIFAAAASEAGSAIDVPSAAAILNASDTEAATAADTSNGLIPGPPPPGGDLHSNPFFATIGPMTSLP